MVQIFDPLGFKRMLEIQVKDAVSSALEEIATKACEDLTSKVMSEADSLALKILSEYDVSMATDRVIITVKKGV